MRLPGRARIIDVGPRDGFQAEHEWIPTERKVEIVNALSRCGVSAVQVTSFVHPRAIPQLADAEEVMSRMDRVDGVEYQVLVPNLKGMERAVKAKPHGVHLMMSATESHNRSNGNRSIEESLRDVERIVPMAAEAGIEVEGGLACAFGCPFEGDVSRQQLDRAISGYIATGIKAINLGDTIGVANPVQVYDTCSYLLDRFPGIRWTLHPHNTRDMALANVLAALQAGLTSFDGSVGGMGGCPYAPGATGNVSTEDMVNMLNEMGVETGVDLDALIAVSKTLQGLIPHPLDSAVVKAGRKGKLGVICGGQVKLG